MNWTLDFFFIPLLLPVWMSESEEIGIASSSSIGAPTLLSPMSGTTLTPLVSGMRLLSTWTLTSSFLIHLILMPFLFCLSTMLFRIGNSSVILHLIPLVHLLDGRSVAGRDTISDEPGLEAPNLRTVISYLRHYHIHLRGKIYKRLSPLLQKGTLIDSLFIYTVDDPFSTREE